MKVTVKEANSKAVFKDMQKGQAFLDDENVVFVKVGDSTVINLNSGWVSQLPKNSVHGWWIDVEFQMVKIAGIEVEKM